MLFCLYIGNEKHHLKRKTKVFHVVKFTIILSRILFKLSSGMYEKLYTMHKTALLTTLKFLPHRMNALSIPFPTWYDKLAFARVLLGYFRYV